MKDILSNVWIKRFVSIIAAFYTVGVGYMCYYSIFYDIHVESRTSLSLIISAVSVIAIILMLYTRKQLLTRISSFLILTFMLPVVLLYFDEKALLIPIVITGVIILLFSGAGEGMKTLVGTIILLMYIFGALGYFLFTSFFVTSAKTEVIESGISPSGRYRYSIVNTEDTSGGSTAIYLEPNYADVEYPFVKFTLKNMEHICYQERPICENVSLEWTTQSRQEITSQLNGISDNIRITLTDSEFEDFGYSKDSRLQLADINVYYLMDIGKTASDVDPIILDELNEEQLAHFDIGRDSTGRYYVLEPSTELLMETGKLETETIYLSELKSKGIKAFNKSHANDWGVPYFSLQKENSLPLTSFSDEQLVELGVSESGDVLTFNGKVCFSFYVAELENYFETDSRKLSLELLS